MKASLIDTIHDVPVTEWDDVVGSNQLLCRHAFLRAVERGGINDCRYVHAFLQGPTCGSIMAHASACLIATDLGTFAQGWQRRFLVMAPRLWPGFLVFRAMECGSPVALGTTLAIRQGTAVDEATLPLLEAIEGSARRHRVAAVLWRDFRDGDLEITRVLEQRGYRRVENLPATELTIRWDTFEAYLASMKSRYRNKILAQMRVFEDAGVQTELIRSFGHLAADLERLWRQSYDHASEYRREVLTADFFKAMDEELGSRSAVLLFRVEGKPVAFSLLLFDDDTLIPLFCGLDYTLNERCSLYFNLLYGAIRVAIERRLTRIDFGITTLFPKVHLGCSIVRQLVYMKHRNPVLNVLLPLLFRAMTPRCPVTERPVFKP